MTPVLVLNCIIVYFAILLLIAWFTSRNSTNLSYFLGNKSSPWYVVALGMISDSLSGVTFISLPGTVGTDKFSYMQIVFGYFFGYLIIARVLLPLYYKLNLTSIYGYLESRLGNYSQMTGSFFFILSRSVGAALRLFLASQVIQFFVCGRLGVPYPVTVAGIIALMLVYTFRGGIRTLVWTDAFQSTMLLAGVFLTIYAVSSKLGFSPGKLLNQINESGYSQIFFWEWREKSFFLKQFLSGAFIAVVMTGLDQNMMQKNLSCRSLPEAQKNIFWFSVVLVIVNLFFVTLGALLYIYSSGMNIALPVNDAGRVITDRLFPELALNHLGIFAGLLFIIGLTAATFSSADSVLTTLTTSFMIDILQIDKKSSFTERKKKNYRYFIHVAFALILFLLILACLKLTATAVIDAIFKAAAYTYGPLLGMFAFGLFTKFQVRDRWVPVVCVISPLVCYFLYENSQQLLGGYKFGYELLLLNGLLTFVGLLLVRKQGKNRAPIPALYT